MDFDNISEADLMSALGDMSLPNKPSENTAPPEQVTNIPEELASPAPSVQSSSSSSIELDSGSIDSITSILKELMSNKTIEISIKIKD